MIKRISLNIFLTLLFLFVLQKESFSQYRDSTLVLTLKDALKISLEKNWDVKISEKDMLKAEEQIDEAYSNAYPRVDFTASYARNIKLPVMFIPPNNAFNPSDQTLTFEIGSKNSYSAGITLSQVIYSQKVNTAIKIADEYAQMSKAGNKATKQEISLNVKKTFYTVLLMKEMVKVSRQGYEVAKANYENVSALYKQGVASEYDNLRAEVQMANTQPLLIQTENNLELTKNALKNLLGISIKTPIEVKGEFIFEDIPGNILEETELTAVAKSPLVHQLSIQESLLDKNITIEKSEYYPTLALFSQYQWQSQENTFHFKNYNWANNLLVGLQLNYTLFDGFRRGARIEQATIDKEKVGLSRRKLEEGISIQVQQAMMKMEEAKKRITAQQKSLQQADKALKISQTRFKSGVGTQLELIDTQAALTFANTNYAQAIYDYLMAKAEWEYSVSIEE